MLQLSVLHAVKGLDPVADVFDTTQYSDVVHLKDHHNCLFTVYIGVGATGTSTFTVEACDDVTPSNTSAIPFHYRQTAASGYGYVRLKSAESVNSPVLGGILVQLFNPRYAKEPADTAIV